MLRTHFNVLLRQKVLNVAIKVNSKSFHTFFFSTQLLAKPALH